MSIGPLGLAGALATSPLPQKAAEVDRTHHESTDRAREAQAEQQAESAAGIGQTEEDSEAAERDADGRRLWEAPANKRQAGETTPPEADAHLSKDPTGESGGQIDLVG
jgi:hypothetical protein